MDHEATSRIFCHCTKTIHQMKNILHAISWIQDSIYSLSMILYCGQLQLVLLQHNTYYGQNIFSRIGSALLQYSHTKAHCVSSCVRRIAITTNAPGIAQYHVEIRNAINEFRVITKQSHAMLLMVYVSFVLEVATYPIISLEICATGQ